MIYNSCVEYILSQFTRKISLHFAEEVHCGFTEVRQEDNLLKLCCCFVFNLLFKSLSISESQIIYSSEIFIHRKATATICLPDSCITFISEISSHCVSYKYM